MNLNVICCDCVLVNNITIYFPLRDKATNHCSLYYGFSNSLWRFNLYTPSALQLAEVVLRIQPSVGTTPPAVKEARQLPSSPPVPGKDLEVHA